MLKISRKMIKILIFFYCSSSQKLLVYCTRTQMLSYGICQTISKYVASSREDVLKLCSRDGSWQLRERVSSSRLKHPGSGVATALALRVVWSSTAAPPPHLLPHRRHSAPSGIVISYSDFAFFSCDCTF